MEVGVGVGHTNSTTTFTAASTSTASYVSPLASLYLVGYFMFQRPESDRFHSYIDKERDYATPVCTCLSVRTQTEIW